MVQRTSLPNAAAEHPVTRFALMLRNELRCSNPCPDNEFQTEEAVASGREAASGCS